MKIELREWIRLSGQEQDRKPWVDTLGNIMWDFLQERGSNEEEPATEIKNQKSERWKIIRGI